jgi:hypothetical protein
MLNYPASLIAHELAVYTNQTPPNPPTFAPGTLAYVDGFGPFVPCKVTNVSRDHSKVHVLITATDRTRTYVKGDVIAVNASRVVPRERVYVRSGQYRIRPYRWIGWPAVGGNAISGAIPAHGDAYARTDHGVVVDLDYTSRGSVWFSTGARTLGNVTRRGTKSWTVHAPVTSPSPVEFTTRAAAWRYALDYADALS